MQGDEYLNGHILKNETCTKDFQFSFPNGVREMEIYIWYLSYFHINVLEVLVHHNIHWIICCSCQIEYNHCFLNYSYVPLVYAQILLSLSLLSSEILLVNS